MTIQELKKMLLKYQLVKVYNESSELLYEGNRKYIPKAIFDRRVTMILPTGGSKLIVRTV